MFRPLLALIRAAWLTAISYRVQTILSLLSIWVTVVPVFFIAGALQPTMADVIRNEGQQYFAFMLIGSFGVSLVSICVGALPAAVQGGISSGFLESLMMTRAPRLSILGGISGYPILWAVLRGMVMVFAGWLIGARVAWEGFLPALLVIGLIVCIHWSIGLFGAALIMAFRTTGPLSSVVVVLSTLLGGAYYPTSVIPSWIQKLSAFVPASYGFRALRRVLLDGASFAEVRTDTIMLIVVAAGLLLSGSLAFRWALSYARRAGSLSHY